MTKHKAVVSNWKKKEVKELENLISKFKIIAIADLTSVPAKPLQTMKKTLKPNTVVRMAKVTLLKVAFKNLNKDYPNIDKLISKMRGMVALVLTNDNPFKLAKILNDAKSPAAAKPGQIAPNDVKVPAGATSFPPGPVIGELGMIGIKTSVEAGKVAVKEDKIVTKRGEEITKPVATVLARLQILPMEIGINLISAYENSEVFDAEILNIDEKEFNNKLTTAITDAFSLAYSITYVTKDNVELFIKDAYINACAVADKGNIITSDNATKVVSKAELQAQALKSKVNLPEAQEKKSTEEVAQDVLKDLQDKKIEEGKT